MATKIDSTTHSTQKGAPNRLLKQTTNQSSHEPNKISRNFRRISHFPKINRHKITHSIPSAPLSQSFTLGSGRSSAFASHSSLACPESRRATSHCFLATLVDGHTVPSKIAVTPAASTKVEKLMDTLSACFATKRRQLKVTL